MYLSITLLVIGAIVTANTFMVIASTGKEREPYTPAQVAGITALNAAIVVFVVLAAMRLGI
jgi:nucleoside recognition membrane protein YjiH